MSAKKKDIEQIREMVTDAKDKENASNKSETEENGVKRIDKQKIIEKYHLSKEDKALQILEEMSKDFNLLKLAKKDILLLERSGITDIKTLAEKKPEDLVKLGFNEEKAKNIIERAKDAMKIIEEKRKRMEDAKRKKEFEERMNAARRYATKLIRKFHKKIKAVVVYGSTVKGTYHEKSDIDVFVIFDDTSVVEEPPEEYKDNIWNELVRIAGETDKRITIQAFMFLTEFWENLRIAEPVLISILRDGIPVYDVGVFMPAKRMVQRGKVPTTKEAVDKKISAAPRFVEYAVSRIKSAPHYLEQAIASAGNAALMMIGRLPVSKEEVPDAIEATFVEKGIIKKEIVDKMREVIKFAKDVEYMKYEGVENIGEITDKYIKMTKEIVDTIREVIDEMQFRSKGNTLLETYKMFLKADVTALRKVGVEPPEELMDLPKVFAQTFPEVGDLHQELFDLMMKYLEIVKEGKEDEISDDVIYSIKEKTKDFISKLDVVLVKKARKAKKKRR